MSQLARISYSTFFDRDAVLKAADRAERKQLIKAGAFVWRRARSLIRKRKRVSKDGNPPSSHTGRYRKSILFAYEPDRGSVVIGSIASAGGSEVPQLLEFGGSSRRDGERVTYDARPHMGPALEAETPNFPDLFAGSITG